MADPYLYIGVMAATTYLVRVIPLALLRREIQNRFFRSFLHYVPYVTLSAMTFPAILHETATPWSAWAALLAAAFLAWRGKSLALVAVAACAVVLIIEWVVF